MIKKAIKILAAAVVGAVFPRSGSWTRSLTYTAIRLPWTVRWNCSRKAKRWY